MHQIAFKDIQFNLIMLIEILLAIAVSFQFFLTFVSQEKKWKQSTRKYSLLILGLILLMNLLINSFSLRMAILIIISLSYMIYFGLKRGSGGQKQIAKSSLPRRSLKIFGILLFGLFIIVGMLVPFYVFPIFELPDPNGQYAVGTTSFELIDNTRDESYTPENDSRKLLIKVLYPADAEDIVGKEPMKYWPEEYPSVLAGYAGVPPTSLDHLADIDSNAYQGVPVSDEKSSYPVLIYSHGFSGFDMGNTILCELLASHGYVVFIINHTYESAMTIFEDGNIARYSYEFPELSESEWDELDPLYDQLMSSNSTLPEKKAALTDLDNHIYWRGLQNSLVTWANDTVYLMDQLELQNEIPSLLVGKLDMSTLGLFGFSWGGATSGEVALLDSRVDAGINMDGIQFGHSNDLNLTVPFMYMYSDSEYYSNDNMNDVPFLQAENTTYSVTIEGTVHQDYSDYTLFSPFLHDIGWFGPIEGSRMIELMSDFVLSFFNLHLLEVPTTLFTVGNPDYTEVMIEQRNV